MLQISLEINKSTKTDILVKFPRRHPMCSVTKGALKFFANFMGKHLCCSLSLIKLQVFRPATLLKANSNTAAFL